MAQRMQLQGEYSRGEDVGDCDPPSLPDIRTHDPVNPTPTFEITTTDAEPADGETLAIRVGVSPSLDELLERVVRFNQEIIGLPPRDRVDVLSPTRTDFRRRHLEEELTEFVESSGEGDADGAADALIDLVYVALGALYEMGVNPGEAFDRVHQANMRKVRGERSKRPGSEGYDAIKPEGWTGPDNSWIMRATPETVELGTIAAERGISADLLRDISDVFLHVARIRAGKGRDYNTSVELHDYFAPWGHQSYHQLLHMKTLRIRSLIELMGRGRVPNYEGLLDSIYDLLNYACFYGEAVREGRLPITGSRGAEENGAVRTT